MEGEVSKKSIVDVDRLLWLQLELTEDNDSSRQGAEESQEHGTRDARREDLEQRLPALVHQLRSPEHHETVHKHEEHGLEQARRRTEGSRGGHFFFSGKGRKWEILLAGKLTSEERQVGFSTEDAQRQETVCLCRWMVCSWFEVCCTIEPSIKLNWIKKLLRSE